VGKVNKLFLPVAKYIFTSFYEIYGINIKYSSKIEFTGNPVRKEIVNLNTLEYKYPSEGEPFNILIIGGSGGASFFTKSFINIFKYFPLELKNKLNIIHQVKMEEEIEIAEQFYKKQSIRHEVKAFFNDIPERMKIANLVVSRAGTGAITELAVVGKAAIFVPSPNVSNNHQFYNAEFFRKNNACLLLEEKDFDEKKFSKVIINLINDEKELKNLSKNIKKLAQLDADKKICNFIIEELN
jgi:UDP-N-acetylglucosamine--N-acetylmuramyl-(pentapeptide) pyrophosphoryl-undecaprenol N-acetylglucosamine transferase